MSIVDLFRESFRAILHQKRRNIVSTFGIAWGVAAVLILAGWGFGLKDLFITGMKELGDNIIFVFPGHTSKGIGGYRAGRVIMLYPEDVEAIKAYCSKVKVVIPVDNFTLPVSFGAKSDDRTVRGVFPDAKTLRNLQPALGRFITPDDLSQRRRVCYLGQKVAEEFFGKSNPLGQVLRIGGVRFTVIGVLKEKSGQTANVGTRDEDLIFIPFTTGRSLFAGKKPVWCIQARAFNPDDTDEAVKEIRKALGAKYHFAHDDEEAVFILPMTIFTKMAERFGSAIAIFVAAVGVITLAIGGISVMNMMLVSVNERFPEIGIRRATGATKRVIQLQFLTETMVLTIVAGLIGLAFGVLLLSAVSKLPVPEHIPLPVLSSKVTILAVVVMVVTALISGIIPARRAASMPPVLAIKGQTSLSLQSPRKGRSILILPGLAGEVISQAIDDIRTSRLRAALTTFGVFWGVAAVALLLGWGIGMREYFLQQIDQLGGRRTSLYGRRIEDPVSGLKGARRLRFTEADIEDIRTNAWYIEYLSPEIWMGFPVVEYRGESRAVHTIGVYPDTRIIRNFEVERGRFINQRDLVEMRKVCFIGAGVKKKLFGNRPAVGKTLRIKGKAFKVIGVAKEKGEQSSIHTSLDDDKILIPYSTAKVLSGSRYPTFLQLHPTIKIPYEEIEKGIRKIILRNHNIESEEALGIFSALEARNEFTKFTTAMAFFLGGVGLVTLLVGSVGVANVMFVSVTQRTREIGIRRAIGARRIHIFLQYLWEAILLCLSGGAVGVLFAWVVAKMLSIVPLPRFFAAPILNMRLTLLIFAFIFGAGVLSGLFPARKAARADVIESLRYE